MPQREKRRAVRLRRASEKKSGVAPDLIVSVPPGMAAPLTGARQLFLFTVLRRGANDVLAPLQKVGQSFG